jgi:hypothetical protein
MAKFEEGNTKSKGRPPGSGNAVTKNIREILTNIFNEDVNTIAEDIRSIKNPAQRVKLKLELLKFIVPQLKSVEATYEGKDVNIINLGNGVNPDITPVTINFTRSKEDFLEEFNEKY